MAVQGLGANTTILGQILKDYRKTHHLTQEELAFDLAMEPRKLRAYENGERKLENIRELRRIADLLGIEPERLGVAPSLYIPKTPEQIEEVLQHAWSLMDEPRIVEARAVIEKLVRDIRSQVNSEDPKLLYLLARAHHAAGYIVSMNTRTKKITLPIYHYQEMEDIARILNDQTLLNTALTYHGDMLRRAGDVRKAIAYLEGALKAAPQADVSTHGNTLQLLGRTYLLNKDKRTFEWAMAESEALAHAIQPETDSTRGQYNLAAVYEEYGKNYGIMGQTQKALDYLDRAEAIRPPTKFWETLLIIARAEIFIYSGDVANGKPLAVEAARLSQQQGHRRRLERIYGMRRHLSRKTLEYGKAEMELSEVLEGPIGYRNIEDD